MVSSIQTIETFALIGNAKEVISPRATWDITFWNKAPEPSPNLLEALTYSMLDWIQSRLVYFQTDLYQLLSQQSRICSQNQKPRN